MPDAAVFLAQGLGTLGALLVAIFGPHAGSASQLVPIGTPEPGAAALWASREDAQLITYDPASGSVTVIAPTTLGLLRALPYGFVPIAAEIEPCGPAGSSEKR